MSSVPGSNPYAPPKAEVADHRGDTQVQLASRGARFGAAVVDGLGASLIAAPLFIGIDIEALSAAATLEGTEGFAAMLGAFSATGIRLFGIASLIWAGINIYFVVTNAQTVGKRMIGIKVARADGSRAGFARIFWLRNVVNTLPTLIPILGGFYGLIDHLFIFGESRRCLHDRIGGTIVINA